MVLTQISSMSLIFVLRPATQHMNTCFTFTTRIVDLNIVKCVKQYWDYNTVLVVESIIKLAKLFHKQTCTCTAECQMLNRAEIWAQILYRPAYSSFHHSYHSLHFLPVFLHLFHGFSPPAAESSVTPALEPVLPQPFKLHLKGATQGQDVKAAECHFHTARDT